MFRKTKYVVVLLLVIWSGSVSAQYNSDYKLVASQHIKTAMGYDAYRGDTSYLRYSYDLQGRVWKKESHQENRYLICTYDSIGNETGRLEIYRQNVKQNGIITYDTTEKIVARYDSVTGLLLYKIRERFLNNSYWAMLTYLSNDTTYNYMIDNNRNRTLGSISVRTLVDSIKYGYAETSYSVFKNDTGLMRCRLFVYDSSNNPLRYYELSKWPEITKAPYNPVGDSSTKFYLSASFLNVYDEYGVLVKTTYKDHARSYIQEYEYPEAWQLSLERVKDSHYHSNHQTMFEYYKQ